MDYPQESFAATKFAPGSFWDSRREVVRAQTLQHQLQMLKRTGRYDAFKLKWHPCYSEPPTSYPVPNHQFWDSDVAKWIEGACNLLMDHFDPEIDAAVKELVQMIREAQQPDGYLNIHYTVVEPEKRFTNLRDMHELYNAGHLIEGALAHHHYYKNEELLSPILKYVDLLVATFGAQDGQIPGYPGHPEIELALLRLYKVTGEPKHLKLAQFFIEERGNPQGGKDKRHYYDVEAEARGENEHMLPAYFPAARSYWYQQAHEPIVDQQTIEGHSVRAMYLLTAVTDLVHISKPDSEFGMKFLPVVHRLWSNMVEKKSYATGGIGSMKKWEGFGIDYFLPQSTDEGGCYAETCAAIGVMMLAERLLQIDLNSDYADMMELCLYNAVLTGMSLDGKAFTYVNQLGSSDQDISQRHEWFEVACCPPNVTRTMGFLGVISGLVIFEVSGSIVEIEQKTNWPWNGDVEFAVRTGKDGPPVDLQLRLRIPGWATSWEELIRVNEKITPRPEQLDVRNGYLYLTAEWLKRNPQFRLSCPMQPRVAQPHPMTLQPVAYVTRGPIVYCVEDVDHPWEQNHFKSTVFDTTAPLREESRSQPDSYVAIIAENGAPGELDTSAWNKRIVAEPQNKVTGESHDLCFIPYYLRANRGGRGQMRVGLRVM
ncbi:Six-hairpin glycosidase [Penicillium pulvis]|uniref:Six-hairpin glycosidase n=1 Tax=Penicillium pulvis TaxID=1562058 RepID=UPI002546EE4A|nr:Six-hairpin glycosidase [Penicillium pulvis]KAJ5805616.1 Six-hairpin glycosidase [Penicillium pulvis]